MDVSASALQLSPATAIIIEAVSVLTPLGLLTTISLAQQTPVWLPRAFWTLLDNDCLYVAHPEALGGHWMPPVTRAARIIDAASALPLWRRAWYHGYLAQAVNVLPDAPYEAFSSRRGVGDLIARFERCARTLAVHLDQSGMGPFDDCARDAAALAAALQPAPALILVNSPAGGEEPEYCSFLRSLGIRVEAGVEAVTLPALSPALRACAQADDRPLAAVSILAPGVVAMAAPWTDEAGDGLDEEDDEPLWDAARAVWFRVEDSS